MTYPESIILLLYYCPVFANDSVSEVGGKDDTMTELRLLVRVTTSVLFKSFATIILSTL